MLDERKEYRLGMICGVGAMSMWGVLPLYWRALIPISSYVLILYRILLVGVTCFVAATKVYGFSEIKATFSNRKIVLKLFVTGLVITSNWSIYIYAINSGQAIEASIGYYIEPLVVSLFGIIIFKERPNKYKLTSLLFACAGVSVVLIHFLRLPFIALSLAISFATYTALKKYLKMRALISLFFETVFIAPIALSLIIYMETTGAGAVAAGQPYQLFMLSLIGIVTATPLAMFGVAANRVSMISLGIVEYITPSLTLIIGIFVFKEAFDSVQFIAFALIWVGLVFFTYGEVREVVGDGKAV